MKYLLLLLLVASPAMAKSKPVTLDTILKKVDCADTPSEVAAKLLVKSHFECHNGRGDFMLVGKFWIYFKGNAAIGVIGVKNINVCVDEFTYTKLCDE